MVFRELTKKVDDYVHTKAIQLLHGGADAYCTLAARYEEMGWREEAIEAYERAISTEPEDPLAYAKLGSIFWRLGQEDKAASLAQKAITLGIQDALPFATLGQVFEKRGNIPEAIKIYRKA